MGRCAHVLSTFENGLNAPQTEVYMHEMPGGQYSNLQQQAKAVGLGHRWDEIKKMYHTVNLMFGDIVKVTPSSKVVGDMALFMVQNHLTEQDVYVRGEELSFPESVVTFFQLSLAIGKRGQNARLAAKLTGHKIDIKSESDMAEFYEQQANQEVAEVAEEMDEAIIHSDMTADDYENLAAEEAVVEAEITEELPEQE